MANVLGILGILVFIVSMIGLAAGVTWVVVKVSPTPSAKKSSS